MKTVQPNTIRLEKRFNKCTATGTVQSNNILVDKRFNQRICSSKQENNTKKPIKYSQTIRTHDAQPQSQSTFELKLRHQNDIFAFVTKLRERSSIQFSSIHFIQVKNILYLNKKT